MESHFVGIAVGVGVVGLGYLLSRVSVSTNVEAEHLKQRPKYYNFSRLGEDLAKDSQRTLTNIFVHGTVAREKYRSGLFVETGVDGVAKLVTTTNYTRVYNAEKETWDNRSQTIVNQCLSIPFKFADRNGNSLTMEDVHNARDFKFIMSMVNQRKTIPEQRTVGDHATNMILREIPNGSLVREYLLRYGSNFAAIGDAIQTSDGSIVFYPEEVAVSVSYLIEHREFIAKIEQIVSTLLIVGGAIQIAVQLYFIHKRMKTR